MGLMVKIFSLGIKKFQKIVFLTVWFNFMFYYYYYYYYCYYYYYYYYYYYFLFFGFLI